MFDIMEKIQQQLDPHTPPKIELKITTKKRQYGDRHIF